MRDCVLVVSGPVGRRSMFSLTHPEAIVGVLTAAAALLEQIEHRSDSCINDAPRRGAA